MPQDVLVPVLTYPSVTEAVSWLSRVFGFRLRWQVAEHRAQLAVGETAAIALVAGDIGTPGQDHVMVRVADLLAHRERAVAAGASAGEVQEFPYGERQYSALDHTGRAWVFTESVADVAPEEWGARVPDERGEP